MRILRGIRFAVTKGFVIPEDLMYIIKHYPYKHKMHVVSEERIREELTKCFKCNTVETLEFLHDIPRLRDYILSSSDAAYRQIRDNAISEFRESLDRAISNASGVLSDGDKLKIMIEVASSFCYV